MFKSGCYWLVVEHGVVALLGFCRRDIADRLQQPAVVEPVDPGQRCELHRPEASPWRVRRATIFADID